MLTPSQYDAIADQIVDLYAQLNESIVEDVARRIMKTGTISESARWQLKQLQESGMLYDDVIAEISKINYQSQQEIQNLFRNAGIESVRNDNIFYKSTGNQVLRLSDSALQVLNAGYQKCAGNLQNLTLTTANNAQQLYLEACNLAYMQVTSGAMDYGTAIRKAVQMASQQGSMVSYPSGHRDQLDVAVRRAVLTGIGQTVRQISVINANDMGCDLMEITAHAGARPSHAHWQGQIVSLSGRRGYLTVRDIGYGDADGFGGINCRHDWYPFFEGISQRTYSPERLQELENHRIQIGDKSYTDYEVSQMQRRLERDIREKKRLVAGARASVDSAPDESTKKQMQELFTNASVRLKKAEKKLDDFCKQTGFRKDNNRVWVNGFGRSTSQKAVWANRKATVKSPSGSGNSGISFSDSSLFGKLKSALTGKIEKSPKSFDEIVEEFGRHISNIQNRTVSAVFQRTYDRTTFAQSTRRNSYFSNADGKVYIATSATPSTVAHEIFHKVDFENQIVKSGMLDRCIQSDYENLKKLAETSGQTLEDMLYLKYPEAFEKKGKMKESFRGVSDIIDGMTNGKVWLGYGHSKKKDYWQSPKRLQKETFAQYGRFYFEENPDVIRIVGDLFPETTKQMDTIIQVINQMGK